MVSMEQKNIVDTVFGAKPNLRTLVETHGEASYLSYLHTQTDATILDRDDAMDALFMKVWEQLMRQYFDARLTTELTDELKKNFFASTADHGGPICHPFFTNAFFARALDAHSQSKELVLTLPCSGVSLDNSSFPRGLFFHDKNLHPVRLHIKSLAERHDSIYSASPYTKEDIAHIEKEISTIDISNEQKRILVSLVKDIFDRNDQYARATYDEQMVRVNWLLPKYVHGYEHVEHISIGQEILVRELLLLHLDSDTFISKLLVDNEVQKVYKDVFDGIAGAHTTTPQKGTQMFWGLDNDGVRQQLSIADDGWYTTTGSLFLKRNKESLRQALIEKKIYPNMALTFIVLCFVHKITCGGGFSQINYLGEMKSAYEKLCASVGHTPGELPGTDVFTGELIVNVLEKDGVSVPATLLDTILYQDDTTSQVLKHACNTIPLKDAIWAMMPEYYKIITGESVDAQTMKEFPLPPATLHVQHDTNI